jgi:hypothetical protein
LGASAEDFKRTIVRTNVVTKNSSWLAQKGYAKQLQTFFRALQESRSPEVTVRDGARATIGCLRLIESANNLTPCTIDLDKTLVPA